ncbi:MAG: DEAD/DEAH box helicase, partial [Myxococcota bacterium]
EAGRFAPGLRVVGWHGPNRRVEDLYDADLVVTSYALLRRDPALTDRVWSWAVLDEAQQIKNPASQVARAARRLQALHRLALTGTPLENDLIELWSLFSFLMPGLLGRRSRFHARYSRSGRLGGGPSLDELFHRLRPFVLRRRKVDVAPELPPRTELTVRVTLSDGEARLYERVRATVRAALTDGLPDGGPPPASVVLDGLTRLRQACCHPGLLPFPEARTVQRSAKLEALVEQVGAAIAAGSRCLVFSQWVKLLDHVADALGAVGVGFLRLQGDTVDRGAVVAAFQAPDGPPALLVSLKAGGTGLNLTAADVVFLLDPWWNPAVEDQAADRAHRIGQTRPVTVVRLVAADTIEDRVLALQDRKRKLFDDTVDRGGIPPLTAVEWEALLA